MKDWVTERLAALLMAVGCATILGAAAPCAAQVTTTVSATSSCTSPYSHVYIMVRAVKAHIEPNAPGMSRGWKNLTPALSSNPVQIDLMAEPSEDCTLGTLGNASTLPAGHYQQIRLLLFGDPRKHSAAVTPPSNACSTIGKLPANVFNCVQLTSDGSFHALHIGSAGRTGIKIPSSQIASGGLDVMANQALDLDIDFNACESVVQAGNSGKFILKPTLHADELGLSPVIDGMVVEGMVSSGTVTAGANAVAGAHVWLEKQSSTFTQTGAATTEQVDQLVQSVDADSAGHFRFCPVGTGTYEIVADTESVPSAPGTPSNATVTTDVVVTANGGPAGLVIPVVSDGTAAATIQGEVTTANSAAAGDDVALAALQSFGPSQALVPFFTGTAPTPPTVTTSATAPGCASGTVCPKKTNCACYSLMAPASNPVIGAASATGTGYSAPSAPPVSYQVGGVATIHGSANAACTPDSSLFTPSFAASGGASTSAPELDFTGCD